MTYPVRSNHKPISSSSYFPLSSYLQSTVSQSIAYTLTHLTDVCYYVWFCTVTENHLGVICAAVPPLRALATRCLGRAWTTGSNSKRSGAANTDEEDRGSGYALKSGVGASGSGSSSRESKTAVDIYPVDSESRENCLHTAAPITTTSPGRGDSSDMDGISELGNEDSNIGAKRVENYSRP